MFDLVWLTQDGRYACLKHGEWWQYGEALPPSAIYAAKVIRPAPALDGAFVNLGERNALLRYDRDETPAKTGEIVLVCQTEPPKGDKLAVVKSRPSLPGRYVVYLPYGDGLRFAKGYTATVQAKWRETLCDVEATLPGGWILRSAAAQAAKETVADEMKTLQTAWRELLLAGKVGQVYRSPDANGQRYAKAAREIWTDDEALCERLRQAYPQTPVFVKRDLPLLFEREERAIAPLLDRRVALERGVALTFDTTQAATVVDVDSGAFPLSGDAQATAREVNRIAAKALVRLLSLRDITGMILADFVSTDETGRRDLLSYLDDLAAADERLKVVDMTALGIVEMTRKGE